MGGTLLYSPLIPTIFFNYPEYNMLELIIIMETSQK